MERILRIWIIAGLVCGLAAVSVVTAEEQWAAADLDECTKMMVEEGLTQDEAAAECEAILSDEMAEATDAIADDAEMVADEAAAGIDESVGATQDMMNDVAK